VRVLSAERIEVESESDIVIARRVAGLIAKQLGMGLLDQTKVATATSELARNIVRYAATGNVLIEQIEQNGRLGVRVTFTDEGPGIRDISEAMRDGFTTGNGMGLGLSGARRLMNEFEITSELGVGTTVIIKKWKQR
jgi:serine/threonine-protein kinase RsbT